MIKMRSVSPLVPSRNRGSRVQRNETVCERSVHSDIQNYRLGFSKMGFNSRDWAVDLVRSPTYGNPIILNGLFFNF